MNAEEANARSEQTMESVPREESDRLAFELKGLDTLRKNFHSLLIPKQYEELRERGVRKFSHKAFLNALFIFLYREEPLMQAPFAFLKTIIEVEDGFYQWRGRHAHMAQKMIGSRIGTFSLSFKIIFESYR